MKRKANLKSMAYPLTIEMQYARLLKKHVLALENLTDKYLIAIVPDLIASRGFIQDADDDWQRRLEEALEKIARGMGTPTQETIDQLDELASGAAQFNERKWKSLVRKAYGVNPSATKPERIENLLSDWAEKNALLIKDISNKAIRQIRDETVEALTNGTSVKDFTDIVQERLDVSDSRAELIARDQVAKLNGDLNKQKQIDTGLSKYVWRTVGDERVRDSHASVDGKEFSWDSPPTETDGNHPGEDYQCRCFAEPLFPDSMSFEIELKDAA